MRTSRSAVLGVFLVVAVALAVFASSSFAVQNVTASGDDLLTEDVVRFASVRTSGAVKADARHDGYRLSFRATLHMSKVDAKSALANDQQEMPDVVIHQVTRLPTFDGPNDQVDFVGPLQLPFGSEALALQIVLSGQCFDQDGVFHAGKGDVRCAEAKLTLGGESFFVDELLKAVEGRVWRTGRDGEVVRMHFDASFGNPGYGFPIASLGEGSETTVLWGPFGGTAEVRKVSFSG